MLKNILPCDGTASYTPDFLPAGTAATLATQLQAEIPWRAETITMWGVERAVPRLVCWFGDGAYTYSGTRHDPVPWLPALLELKEMCEVATGARFNSVLANLYRDGRDSVAWHADDEADMGETIASVSLGAPRMFRLRHKQRTAPPLGLTLASGSLLVMGGAMQRHWEHAIPKTAKPAGPRVNLTFRWLKP